MGYLVWHYSKPEDCWFPGTVSHTPQKQQNFKISPMNSKNVVFATKDEVVLFSDGMEEKVQLGRSKAADQ